MNLVHNLILSSRLRGVCPYTLGSRVIAIDFLNMHTSATETVENCTECYYEGIKVNVKGNERKIG